MKFAVAATQIAFGYGGASTTIRSYGPSRVASGNRNQDSASNGMLSINSGFRLTAYFFNASRLNWIYQVESFLLLQLGRKNTKNHGCVKFSSPHSFFM